MMLTLFILQSQSWACDTDMFEPNNSQTQSTTMSDGTYTNRCSKLTMIGTLLRHKQTVLYARSIYR